MSSTPKKTGLPNINPDGTVDPPPETKPVEPAEPKQTPPEDPDEGEAP
jgi:hypothetical protein